jgi:hypothetical protein
MKRKQLVHFIEVRRLLTHRGKEIHKIIFLLEGRPEGG